MLQILLDEAFPAGSEVRLTRNGVRAVRAVARQDSSESAFVSYAVDRGCNFVGLIGARVLARSDLLTAAREAGLTVIATHSEDALEGVEHLERMLDRVVEAHSEQDVWLVFSREIKAHAYEDFLEDLR